VSLGLVVAAAVGCGGPTPVSGTPTHVVVAISGSAVERQAGETTQLAQLLVQAGESDDATLDLVVDRPAGPEPVGSVDLVPRRGQDVEHNDERRAVLEGRIRDDVAAELGRAAGDSGRIDVLGLLGQVGRVPGPVTAVVVSSGLQTAGPLAIDTIGWDMVGSDAVLDQAVQQELLPDLSGKTVVFQGLGDVAGAQERLPERLRSRLIRMWVGLCQRAKATDCRVDPEVAGNATPVSTVPAPLTEVPGDPQLALPTVADEPAVTELPADVLFEPNSADLLPGAAAMLEKAAADLPATARIDLVGRTATFGTAESSRAFSLDRARACRDALVAAGVPAERISTSGLGFDQPLVPDVDAGGRLIPDAARRNRTVTMTITAGGMP
jgi:outer membrane protein OmpA-like peptidoglycan-associated protein